MKDVSFLLKNQLTIFRKIIEEKQVFYFWSFGELYCLNIVFFKMWQWNISKRSEAAKVLF